MTKAQLERVIASKSRTVERQRAEIINLRIDVASLKDAVEAAQWPLIELLNEFRAYQGEDEFSTDEGERHMFDLLKRGLSTLGWKDDKPEEVKDFAERLIADRIE